MIAHSAFRPRKGVVLRMKRIRTATGGKKKILFQWGQIVLGLLVFAFGVHLTIFANIGLGPWDCLAMGLS